MPCVFYLLLNFGFRKSVEILIITVGSDVKSVFNCMGKGCSKLPCF